MPDFERVLRDLEVTLEPTEEGKEGIRKYYKGLDHGRIELCVVLSIEMIILIGTLYYFKGGIL